jgi:protein N-lysine methyltransferase METTL21D
MSYDLRSTVTYSRPIYRIADVTYNTSSFPALLRTLASLLALSPRDRHHNRSSRDGDGDGPDRAPNENEPDEREPLVLLAYKERDPAERQLWDVMARETGVVLECVGKQAGWGGLPVEVWLGRRRRKGEEATRDA